MRHAIIKDQKSRYLYKVFEKKRLILKSIVVNKFLDRGYRIKAQQELHGLKGYRSILKNYCILSGRSSGILRKFNISRHYFKYLASFGYLRGVKKASW